MFPIKKYNYTLTIILQENINPNSKILFWASKSSPNNTPYESSLKAYENTPSKGIILAKDGKAVINILYPGSYWETGNKFQKPHIHFKICDTGIVWTSKLHQDQISEKSNNYLTSPYLFLSYFVVIILFILLLFNLRK